MKIECSRYNTPFTQGLRPLCLPCATTKPARSPLKAEGRPNGCLGRSRVAHRTFRHRHGRHGRREVLSMFKTVAQRSPRRSVSHRSVKGGRMKAHTSPWSQNGCTVVDHWSPSKKCEHCVSIWATRSSFGRLRKVQCIIMCTCNVYVSYYLLRNKTLELELEQGSCCSSYTETELSGFRWPLSVLTIFVVAQRWHEGRSPV